MSENIKRCVALLRQYTPAEGTETLTVAEATNILAIAGELRIAAIRLTNTAQADEEFRRLQAFIGDGVTLKRVD